MPPDQVLLSTLNGSNYPCLELNFMVPTVFEPLKFDCILNEPLYCIAPDKKGLRNKTNTVELQWLEHPWDHENLFETGIVRANEG